MVMDKNFKEIDYRHDKSLDELVLEDNVLLKTEPLYVMTVEIEEGNSQTINIYPQSTPKELAYEFCKKNNLDFAAMNYLTDQIENLMKELNEAYEHNFDPDDILIKNESIQELHEEDLKTDKSNKSVKSTLNSESKNLKQVYPKSITQKKVTSEYSNNNICSDSGKGVKYNNQDKIDKFKTVSSYKKSETQETEILNTKKLMEGHVSSLGNEVKEKTFSSQNKKSIAYQAEIEKFWKGNDNAQTREKSSNKNKLNKSDDLIGKRENRSSGFKDLTKHNCKDRENSHYKTDTNNQCLNNNFRNSRFKITNNILKHSDSDTSQILNYGERLYQKGLKLKDETLKRLQHYRKEQETDDAQMYSYKPQINPIPTELLRRRYENSSAYNSDQYVLNYNDYIEARILKLREKYEEREELSFTPNIDKNSEKLYESRSTLNSRQLTKPNSRSAGRLKTEELYELARVKRLQREQMTNKAWEGFSYKPNICEYSYSSNEMKNLNFIQRQEMHRQKSQERINKMKDCFFSTVDKSTGQSLFIPNIRHKSSQNSFNSTNNVNNSRQHTSNIFNSLYSHAIKTHQAKNEIENVLKNTAITMSQSVHTISDSEIIFNKMKQDIFKKIFNTLDGDQDDSISPLYLNTKNLPNNILNILQPILNELKEENETLNEQEFIRACMHLYEIITYNDKRVLIEFGMKKEPKKSLQQEFTFKPTIDKNSRRLDENKYFAYTVNKSDIVDC